MRKPRSSAYNRDVSRRKALRKQRIAKSWQWSSEYYEHLHQYSKNKIHCSCGMCMAKTRNKSRRHVHGNYAPSINYKPSDLRRQNAMDLDEQDYFLSCVDDTQERILLDNDELEQSSFAKT